MKTIDHWEGDKYMGKTKFFPNLLRDAIVHAVKEVRGVARLGKKIFSEKIAEHKAIKIAECTDSDELLIDIEICIEYGNQIADVAYRVQEAVIDTAAQLTSKKIRKVNVFVRGTKYKKADNGADTKQK